MTNRDTILNELAELGSSLNGHHLQNIYAAPAGYFDGLADQILNRIKALNATNAKDELQYLSPLLSNVSKEMPYTVPVGFFQKFGEDVLKKINENDDHLHKESLGQTSEKEIGKLSPLLNNLRNKNPYTVPAGYFETLGPKVVRMDSSKKSLVTYGEHKETKVISISRRKWYRLAAVAVVIGIVVIGGLLFFKQGQINPVDNPHAWIEKNVKTVDKAKIDELVTLTNGEINKPDIESEAVQKAEIKELMKDVPEKDIEEFLNDAVALESSADADGVMNE